MSTIQFPATGRFTIQGDFDNQDGHKYDCYLVHMDSGPSMAVPTSQFSGGSDTIDYAIVLLNESPITCVIQLYNTNLWLKEDSASSDLVFEARDSQPSGPEFTFVMQANGLEDRYTTYSISAQNDSANFISIMGPRQDNGFPVKSKAAGKGKTQKWKFVPVLTND